MSRSYELLSEMWLTCHSIVVGTVFLLRARGGRAAVMLEPPAKLALARDGQLPELVGFEGYPDTPARREGVVLNASGYPVHRT